MPPIESKIPCAWGPCGKLVPVQKLVLGRRDNFCSDKCYEDSKAWMASIDKAYALEANRLALDFAERIIKNKDSNNLLSRLTCRLDDHWLNSMVRDGEEYVDSAVLLTIEYGDISLITIDIIPMMEMKEEQRIATINKMATEALSRHLIGDGKPFLLEERHG